MLTMTRDFKMEYNIEAKDINNKGLSVSSVSPYFINAIKNNEKFKNISIKDIHIKHKKTLLNPVNVKILTNYREEHNKVIFEQVLTCEDKIICESIAIGEI